MAPLPRYRQGRIIWARLRTGAGKREMHPAIIITRDGDIIQPEQFDPRSSPENVNAVAVVGVSTEYKKYPPYVSLPYSSSKGGHPITKLTNECGACIGWYDWVVLEDDVEGRGGDVPPVIMDQIAFAIVTDLRKKLAAKAGRLSKELQDIHELLAVLIGEP